MGVFVLAKVKIVVDSSTDIPAALADELGITIIPMPVSIEGRSYLEGVDLTTETFYPLFKDLRELPKTSQPNLQDLVQTYRAVASDECSVIAIHLSSGLSGTFQTAVLAKEMVGGQLELAVVDSLGASFGAGLLAIRAAELARDGLGFSEIVNSVEDDKRRMRYVFTPGTLEFLIKGGRLGKIAGMVGSLLEIKPLFRLNAEGKIEAFGKVRGRRPALRKLAETMTAEISVPASQAIGIAHSMCPEDVSLLIEEIRERVSVKEILVSEIGCTIGSHTGPGCIALFYRY